MPGAAVDVVVVTTGSDGLVLECLARLADTPVERIIVVVNGGTGDAIRAVFTDAAVIEVETPTSLAAAYNAGAAQGGAELVLFLNDDVLAANGAIAMLADELRARPAAVAAAGRLVDAGDGATQQPYAPRPFPGLGTFAATLTGVYRVWPRNPWTGSHLARAYADGTVELREHVGGACLLVRRAVFDEVGRWDERFAFWFEDVDLSRRLVERGPIVYVPAARFEHVGGASARRLSEAEVVERFRTGALLYGRLHFGRPQRLGLGALFAATSALRALTSRDAALAAAHRRVLGDALNLMR
jgi:GT2 family glycosyltransferase